MQKGKEIVAEAIAIDPDFPDLYMIQAQIAEQEGDHGASTNFAEKAFQLDPNHNINLGVGAQRYIAAGRRRKDCR